MTCPPQSDPLQIKPFFSPNSKREEVAYEFTSRWNTILGHRVHAMVSTDPNLLPCSSSLKSFSPIVLVHGALASRRYLMPTAELLARYMPVFVPELPGHGASSKPHRALSVEHQADILFRWFQLNKLQRANIFANSYGCQIVAQLAVDHPEIVDRLILTGPTGDPAAPTVWQRIYRLLLDGLFEPCGAKRQLFRDLCDMTFPIICGTVRCMMKNDIKPNLRAITCRTLVVRGGNDPIASQAWTEEVARTISGAQLIVMPEAPHCVNFANAEELTGILVQFLNEP